MTVVPSAKRTGVRWTCSLSSSFGIMRPTESRGLTHEEVRARALRGGLVIGVEHLAIVEALAAATNAARQAVADADQRCDLVVEAGAPALGERLPLLLRRRALGGE